MEYKDERSEDLRLHLFRGSLELEAFPLLARDSRLLGEFSVDASIIGASHAVQVRVGDETVTEVLACRVAAVDLYADRLAGVWAVNEEVLTQPAPSLDYAFGCELWRLDEARVMLADFRTAVCQANTAEAIGLSYRFPQKTTDVPETLLLVSTSEWALSIRSVHVYPADGVGGGVAVFSETSLSLTATPLIGSEAPVLEVVSR